MMSQLKKAIHQAIILGDAKRLRECFYTLKTLMLEGRDFSGEDINFFCSLLASEKFIELGGGWYFAMLFSLTREGLPFSESLPFPQSEQVRSALSIADDYLLRKIPPELLEEAIEQAIDSGQELQMEECASAISSAVVARSYFPEKYFDLILNFLNKKSFLTSKGSWHLLYLLDSNWEILSEAQKNRLLPWLESTYSSFTDWMAWFVISEILGECFANEQAFNILCRLKHIEAETPRSLIPHGLEHIVTDSDDQQLAQKAYTELLQMKSDPSEQVRDEVDTSLQRITNRGISY